MDVLQGCGAVPLKPIFVIVCGRTRIPKEAVWVEPIVGLGAGRARDVHANIALMTNETVHSNTDCKPCDKRHYSMAR